MADELAHTSAHNEAQEGNSSLSATHGAFITVEGIDGSGKSTQLALLTQVLEAAGYELLQLREPGGVPISEKIRAILKDPANEAMGDTCELLLFEAARAQLVHEKIVPALAEGKVVVSDRFYDSTTCYQAFADGLDRRMVGMANELAVNGVHPLITLVYDIDAAAAAARRAARSADDRIEAKGLAYQQKVAEGFRTLAAEEPGRIKLIDAQRSIAEVFADTVAHVRAAGFAIDDAQVAAALATLEA